MAVEQKFLVRAATTATRMWRTQAGAGGRAALLPAVAKSIRAHPHRVALALAKYTKGFNHEPLNLAVALAKYTRVAGVPVVDRTGRWTERRSPR